MSLSGAARVAHLVAGATTSLQLLILGAWTTKHSRYNTHRDTSIRDITFPGAAIVSGGKSKFKWDACRRFEHRTGNKSMRGTRRARRPSLEDYARRRPSAHAPYPHFPSRCPSFSVPNRFIWTHIEAVFVNKLKSKVSRHWQPRPANAHLKMTFQK